MQITILPTTEQLQTLVKQHGAFGWVVLKNIKECKERGNKPASLVCKDNKMVWVLQEEIK